MNELKKIQYNCRKATYLIDKRMIGHISFRERIELRIHLAGCGVCRLYIKQSYIINAMIRQLLRRNAAAGLDAGFKETLQQRINEQLDKN